MMINTSKVIMLVLVTLMVLPLGTPVMASNINGSWSHNNITFDCRVSDLNKTSNVDECNDITTSTGVLEHSKLVIDDEGSGSNIVVYAWVNCSCSAGRASTTYNSNNETTYAFSVLNKNLKWEDSTLDKSTDGYDWQTATAHEIGHNVGLGHHTSSTHLMYSTLS